MCLHESKIIIFFCNLGFVAKSVLVRLMRFYLEKTLAENCARGEKITNMRHGNDYNDVALRCYLPQKRLKQEMRE